MVLVMRRARQVVGCFWLGLMLGSCRATSEARHDAGTPRNADGGGEGGEGEIVPVPAAPVVLLVVADTLRADRLAAYGHHRETTPAWSARAPVVIEGLRGVTSWTPPAAASILTASWPENHGVMWLEPGTDHTTNQPVLDPTFPARLQELGYTTLLISGNSFVTDTNGMDAGFDVAIVGQGAPNNHALKLAERTIEQVANFPGDSPMFIWFQPLDQHTPYLPEPEDLGTWSDLEILGDIGGGLVPEGHEFAAQMEELSAEDQLRLVEATIDVYDEALLSLDRGVERLIEGLGAQGREVRVMFISDHGETLADTGMLDWGHGGNLRPELIELPLMFDWPDLPALPEGCLFSVIDLGPTLLDLLGAPPLDGPDVQGVSIFDGCRERTRSTLWQASELRYVTIEDTKIRYTTWCSEGQSWVTDRVDDPDELTPLEVSALPDPSWQAEMDSLIAEIEAETGYGCGVD